jgi:peptide-methionine (S)-S-oxide reductase
MTKNALTLVLICGIAAMCAPPATRAAGGASNGETPRESIVLAGGCFWGMEAVFGALAGVDRAVPGYAGGSEATAHYAIVSTGMTGHAEAVEIVYDPVRISLRRIFEVFFTVAHDPTQLDRQGPDAGRQYRSAIFYRTAEQKRAAAAAIRRLNESGTFRTPAVTTLEPLGNFYPAEDEHRAYVARHPGDPYVAHNDLPKLALLRRRFPELVRHAAH